MNIVKQTPTRITFSNSETASFLQIVGGLSLVLGFCLVKLIPGKVVDSLVCNRIGANQGTCQILNLGYTGGDKQLSFPVGDLEGAKVRTDVMVDRKGNQHISYELVLLAKGHEPIDFISDSDQEKPSAISDRINNFVNNSNLPSLEEKVDNDFSFFKYVVGFIFGVISLFLMPQSSETYTFAKNSNVIIIKKRGLIGNKKTTFELCNNVLDIQIEEIKLKNNNYYSVWLMMKSGKQTRLCCSSTRDECTKVANDIRKIINLK